MGKEGFVVGLLDFYVYFFEGLAKSVEILSKIQKEYSDDYKKLKNAQLDPSKVYDLYEKLSSEDKRLILDVIFRAGSIQAKTIKLFDLNENEQKKLVTEMQVYIKDLKELKEKGG